MVLSPVLISAYSRPDHLKRCLESLQDCDFSENTDVFITIDAPLTSDVRDLNKENHSVANMDWNFKSVNVISHEKNTDGEIIKIEAKRPKDNKEPEKMSAIPGPTLSGVFLS